MYEHIEEGTYGTLSFVCLHLKSNFGKGVFQIQNTGAQVLDKTRPFLHFSIVGFWMPAAHSKEPKYHIFMQYWYIKYIPVFI